MIKLLGACFHDNIGDNLTTRYQRGLLEALTNTDVLRVSYDVFTEENLFTLLYNTSALVLGCGGLFGAWHTGSLFHVYKTELLNKITQPLIIWASGFNIEYGSCYHDDHFMDKCREIFDKCTLIGVRTIGDRDKVISLGISPDKCYFAPDPITFIGSDMPAIEDQVGIALDMYATAAFPDIVQILRKYLAGYNIYPICHERTDHALWEKGLDFSFKYYQDSQFIISGKFHSGVFATAYGKPFFTLEHNIKQAYYREMVYGDDPDTYCQKGEDPDEICNKLWRFITRLDELRDKTIKAREDMRKAHQVFCNLIPKACKGELPKIHIPDTCRKKLIVGGRESYYPDPRFRNMPEKTEREVIIPLLWNEVIKNDPSEVLEVGNVLMNYIDHEHTIVDLYEKNPRVINEDIRYYTTSRRFRLIVSFSTLEHVGDGKGGNDFDTWGIVHALANMRKLLTDDGIILFSVPIGQNRYMDDLFDQHLVPNDEIWFLKRLNADNDWAVVGFEDVIDTILYYPYKGSNGERLCEVSRYSNFPANLIKEG